MYKFLFFILILGLAAGCTTKETARQGTEIVAGKSSLSGQVILPQELMRDSLVLTLFVPHPISGEVAKHEVLVGKAGKFSVELEVETALTYVVVQSSVAPYKPILLQLQANQPTELSITYNHQREVAHIESKPDQPSADLTYSLKILDDMLRHMPTDTGWVYPHLYSMSLDEFFSYAKESVDKRVELYLSTDSLLSASAKKWVAQECRLWMYSGYAFEYEDYMLRNYRNATGDTLGRPSLPHLDVNYFRFLKDLDLSDSGNRLTFEFSTFQNLLLQAEGLSLPPIGEMEISEWIGQVKTILAPQIGFDEGEYYEILAANAYGRQLIEQAEPLSEVQKERIHAHWGEGPIAQILLRKNAVTAGLAASLSPLVKNDVSSVPPDELLSHLLSKYSNKVVLIDFWATWCGPCLAAMKDMRTMKKDIPKDQVAFVYLTNGSSPQKRWEEMIAGIGGDHYYLNEAQWLHLMEQFDFEGIPSYVIYKGDGSLANQFTGYPGNAAVKKFLDEAAGD